MVHTKETAPEGDKLSEVQPALSFDYVELLAPFFNITDAEVRVMQRV